MFGKKKKKIEISGPSNFEHRVHTGFDPQEQKFTGLPQQWHSLLADTANRPKPMVDPSCITPIQLAPMKVLCLEVIPLPLMFLILKAVFQISAAQQNLSTMSNGRLLDTSHKELQKSGNDH
ncbi:hypothetical protein ACRRTK_013618 [Alexandromys fortis]